MKKLGIIGCGAIGKTIALALDKEKSYEITAITDLSKNMAESLKSKLKNSNPKITTTEELIEMSEIIVECAGKDTVNSILNTADNKNKEIIFLSVAGLLENMDLLNTINNTKIHIPSGAITGIDALKSIPKEEIESVTLTTTKPKQGLIGAPYLEENNIDIENIETKTILFEGNVYEAIKGFPKNINVSATVSLAGIGPENTKVKIILDPKATTNTHELEIRSKYTNIKTTTENRPSADNPKTSHLASLSAIKKIKELNEKINTGT